MKCNRCNKEGARPYKYKDDGNSYDVYLCDGCFEFLSSPQALGGAVEARGKAQAGARRQGGGILGMERRCPTCGTGLASIRKTGYLGCADCFNYFRNELVPTIDKFQNGILTAPEKRQRELTLILLEDEYATLLERRSRRPSEMNAISARLREIELQLAALGVRMDE